MGGYFQFFTKNRPQKHQNRAILHTSQANVGGSSPPLATLLSVGMFRKRKAVAAIVIQNAFKVEKKNLKNLDCIYDPSLLKMTPS